MVTDSRRSSDTHNGHTQDGNGDTIHVVVADSREAMRQGLLQILNSDDSIRVIGEARDEKEALAQVDKLCPDVVILDVATMMRGVNGIDVINRLKQSQERMGIIAISDGNEPLVSAIENGVAAFLNRDFNRNELIAAVRLAYVWHSMYQDYRHFTLVKL